MSTLCKGLNISNRYVLKEFIGQGSFGEVWLAYDEVDAKDVALKLYTSLAPEGIDDFKTEFFNTAGLLHPNLLVPSTFEVWETRPYLISEYCSAGSASNLAGLIAPDRMWKFVRDIAEGLNFLHTLPEPIIHQDIKPDNILIGDDERFMITDFGISRRMRNTMGQLSEKMRMGGAVSYMAPERFGEEPEVIKASDIWSLGASIYELATGRLPFDGLGGGVQRNGAETPHLPPTWPEALDALMVACLDVQSWKRPTADEISAYAQDYIDGNKAPLRTWLNRPNSANPAPPVIADMSLPVSETATKVAAPANKIHRRLLIAAIAVLAVVVVSLVCLKLVNHDDSKPIKEKIALAEKADADVSAAENSSAPIRQTDLAPDDDDFLPDAVPSIRDYEPASVQQPNDRVQQSPERANAPAPVGYVDPADGNYVPAPKKNQQASVMARRLDGSMPEHDYYAKHPKHKIDNSQPKSSNAPKNVNYSQDNATALALAAQNGDYNKLKSLAASGYAPAYVPLATLCVRTGRYTEAEAYAQKAKAAGMSGADAVISYLRNAGYYD